MISIQFTYWKDGEFYVGHLNEFPDYDTQGLSIEELKENLKSLYEDIKTEKIPFIRHVAELELV